MGPIHLILPPHDPEFFPGTTSSQTHTTFVNSLHAFHPPFNVIRALKSDLHTRLQRTLPLWDLVRKLIRAGRRSSKPGPVETGVCVNAFSPNDVILVWCLTGRGPNSRLVEVV